MEDGKLQVIDGHVICPRCDGNGLVYKAKLYNQNKQLQITVFMCDECEALWEEGKVISFETFQDTSTYLEKYACSYRDTEILDRNYKWLKE